METKGKPMTIKKIKLITPWLKILPELNTPKEAVITNIGAAGSEARIVVEEVREEIESKLVITAKEQVIWAMIARTQKKKE